MNNVNSAIDELLSLLDKKRQLFDDIMKITLEQKKGLEENAANNIERLVNRKQTVIDRIDETDKSFAEKFNLLKKHLNIQALEEVDFTKYPELKNLKFKVEEIMLLAQNIMQLEESNRDKLVAVINEIKKEMKHLSIGKKSIKAYEKPNINNDGIFIDKKK